MRVGRTSRPTTRTAIVDWVREASDAVAKAIRAALEGAAATVSPGAADNVKVPTSAPTRDPNLIAASFMSCRITRSFDQVRAMEVWHWKCHRCDHVDRVEMSEHALWACDMPFTIMLELIHAQIERHRRTCP